MTRALTSGELELLRKDGQWTKLYLAILKPNTIYTARLDVVPTSNDRVFQIAFDNGSGTLSDVKPGMTLYVGTTAGAHDLGMCRIRKDPVSGTFYIGLTSEIDWAANCYLTVVDEFDLWPKHAVIDSGALKMDVDVAYSDQHTDFNPVPVLGPHAVAKLEGTSVDVQFGPPDGDASWVFGSTIDSYEWVIPDAIAIDDDTALRPIATFDTVGTHVAYCTVTADNGKSTTGVRKAYIWDDENPPATVFQLAQCIGDYDSGGWMFDLSMQDEASLSEIRDRSLVILFAEDWYGTFDDLTKQSIGPIEGRENIVCVGRIVGESIRWDRETGLVHFTVQGAHHWLNKIKAFPIELLFATNTPDSFSVLPSMTVDRILWHILYWHSTVIETMDFYPPNDTRLSQDGRTLASMVWGQLLDIARSRLLASPGVDRFGRLIIEVDPQMVPEADRDWPTVMELTDDDWQEGIELQRVTVEDVSMITLSSQRVDESGNQVTLYSLSPGHAPRRYGEPLPIDRLLAATQSQSNSLAGLALGWHINPFPDVPVTFLQNNRMFDLWPRQFGALTIAEEDTPRAISYDGNLIPRRIAMYFDADMSYMHPEINFEAETFEQINTDGDVPDVEDLSIPPFPGINLPTLPDLPVLFPGDPSSTPDGPSVVVLIDDTKGILVCRNFNADNTEVSWQFANAGIAGADIPYIATGDSRDLFFITPSGAVYVGIREKIFERWFDTVYRAPALGATFVKIIDQAWLDANEGTDAMILGMGYNPNKLEEVAMILGTLTNKHFWIGNPASGFTQEIDFLVTQDFTGSLTFGGGMWVWDMIFSNNEFVFQFPPDGSSVTEPTSGTGYGQGNSYWHARAVTSPVIVKSKPLVTGIGNFLRTEDNGDTFVAVDDGTVDFGPNVAIAPDGMHILANWDMAAGQRGKSSDGGATWSGLPNLPFGGPYCFAYAGGVGAESRWIAARGVVRYSDNAFGAENWLNKEGNINYLIPVGLSINKIIVPGYHNG